MEPKLLHPNSSRRRADSSRAKLLRLDRRGECEKRERKLRKREREKGVLEDSYNKREVVQL